MRRKRDLLDSPVKLFALGLATVILNLALLAGAVAVVILVVKALI